MSQQEQSDYPQLAHHYRIGIAFGLSKERAKSYAISQINNYFDHSFLTVK